MPRQLLGGVVIAVLVAVPAFGQSTDDPIKKGSIEVGGSSAFSFTSTSFSISGGESTSSSDSNATVLLLNGTGAFYVSPRIGVGGMVGIAHFSFPAGGLLQVNDFSMTATSLGGLVKVRFPMGGKDAKPKDFYVLATGGAAIFSGGGAGSASGPAFSIGAGADIFLSRQIAFNVGAQFQHTSLSGLGASGFAVGLGMNVVLK